MSSRKKGEPCVHGVRMLCKYCNQKRVCPDSEYEVQPINKKIIGIKVTHVVELNHPIETDIENPNKELTETTDEIFVGVDNLMYELGHNHKRAVAGYIYEGEEL